MAMTTLGYPRVGACIDTLQDTGEAHSVMHALEIAASLDLDGVELSRSHVLADGIDPIAKECARLGLAICGTHNNLEIGACYFDDAGSPLPNFYQDVELAIETANELGAPLATFGIGTSRRIAPGLSRSDAAARFVRALTDAAEKSRSPDLRIAIELISERTAAFFNSAEELMGFLRESPPWLGITCDTFQAYQQGVDPIQEVERALPRLCHVQVAEVGRRPPGEGNLNLRLLSSALNAGAFEGWVSIELKPPVSGVQGSEHPTRDLRFGVEHLRAVGSLRLQADSQRG